jgi:fructose-specific phosphotransferase system IIC component
MVGGWLATHLGVFVIDPVTKELHEANAGFLGAMLAGLLAGWVVNLIKTIPFHKYIKPIVPILIIPIVSSTVIGVLMLKVIGIPIADLMSYMGTSLISMNEHHWGLVLAALLGAMIAFDMGGPINKAAFFFGAGLIGQGNYTIMGCVAAAICVPPLGLGLATMVYRKLWSEEQRESGIASLAMGMIGITEGAIPFAAADPLRVIPCICAGSALAAMIAMAGGVGDHAPHGGPIVLLVIDHRIMYVIAILVGTIFTAVAINAVKMMTNKRQPATAADAPVAVA